MLHKDVPLLGVSSFAQRGMMGYRVTISPRSGVAGWKIVLSAQDMVVDP